jgi:hypothetical protein
MLYRLRLKTATSRIQVLVCCYTSLMAVGREAGWVPTPVWVLERNRKFLPCARTKTPVIQPLAISSIDWAIAAFSIPPAGRSAACTGLLHRHAWFIYCHPCHRSEIRHCQSPCLFWYAQVEAHVSAERQRSAAPVRVGRHRNSRIVPPVIAAAFLHPLTLVILSNLLNAGSRGASWSIHVTLYW